MLYNGVFGCHGNTCYVIFIGAIFYMIYRIVQVKSMCVPILKSIGSELTSCDAKTLRHASWGLRHF